MVKRLRKRKKINFTQYLNSNNPVFKKITLLILTDPEINRSQVHICDPKNYSCIFVNADKKNKYL